MSNSLNQLQRLLGLNNSATKEDAKLHLDSKCAYEKALICKMAVDENYFSSLRRLAEALGDDVYKDYELYAKLGAMPLTFLNAFENKNSIQSKWIRNLHTKLIKDPDLVFAKSKEVQQLRASGEKWPAAKVYKYLTSSSF